MKSAEELAEDVERLRQETQALHAERDRLGEESSARADECRVLLSRINGWHETADDVAGVIRARLVALVAVGKT